MTSDNRVHVCCTGCGAPLIGSLIRNDIYIDKFITPHLWKATYALCLCENCAEAFDKAIERATEWERKKAD